MSKYTQEQETEIVKDALFLTKTIELEENKLQSVIAEKFYSQPVAPVHQKLTAPHIEPKIPAPPKTTYSLQDMANDLLHKNKKMLIIAGVILGVLLIFSGSMGIAFFAFGAIFAIPAIIGWFAFTYYKKTKELNQQLTTTPEYFKAVEEAKKFAAEEQDRINKETSERQAKIDAQYATDLEKYNNVLIPNYKKDLAKFEEIRQKKIDMFREDIELNRETLEALYQETKIISLTYRSINTLLWLYNDMSTSDHDIRYATEMYDRQRQLNATLAVGSAVQTSINNLEASVNGGLFAIFEAIEQGNDELAKTRRNENFANTISIIQRHNLNKMVKDYTK